MSLNGLESGEVQTAFNTAIAEGAGWFLLKYTTRDAVDLLAQGRGGVSEARSAISAYAEKSPLYGLLMYRRRRILIKFIPEGTSRLLQVRTNVHLQDVLEKYSPYETLLEIASADALSDTSLASSFPMHAAAASPSPSGGRLDEIHEDEDEEPGQAKEQSPGTSMSGRMLSAQRHKSSRRMDNMASRTERAERLASILNAGRSSTTSPIASVLGPPQTQAVTAPAEAREEKDMPLETPTSAEVVKAITSKSHETPAASSIDNLPSLPSPAIAEPPRAPDNDVAATQTSTDLSHGPTNVASDKTSERIRSSEDTETHSTDRPSFADRTSSMSSRAFSLEEDPYDLSKYDELFKPKIKLGPRPVSTLDKTKRAPRVSAVPASFRSALKKSDASRPTSRSSMAPPTTRTTPSSPAPAPAPSPALSLPARIAPPIPPSPEYDPRPISRSSVKSTASHRSQGMTPDKLRLMKALEFRKRQMRKSQQQAGDDEPIIDAEAPNMPKLPSAASDGESPIELPAADQAQETRRDSPKDMTNGGHHAQTSKADSGIEMQYDQADEKVNEMDYIAEDEDKASTRDARTSTLSPEDPSTNVTSGEEQADAAVDLQEHIDERPVSPVSEIEEAPASEGAKKEDESDVKQIHAMKHSWLNISEEDVKKVEERLDSHDDTISTSENQTFTAHADAVQERDANTMAVPTIAMEAASRPASSDGLIISGEASPAIPAISDVNPLGENTSTPVSGELVKQKRRGVVEPLELDSCRTSTVDGFSSDDELLEELHSATVEEARPVQVARSPISPVNGGYNWSNQQNIDETASVRSVKIYRSPSDQRRMENGGKSPSPQPSRSISAASRSSPTPPLEKMDLATKMARNVSSGISRRIQALNQSTSKEANSSSYSMQSHPLTPESSPNSFLHQDQKDRTLPPRMPSNRRLSSKFNSPSSREGTPTLEKGPVWSVQHDPKTNNPSVSVTTRIVRPQQEPDEASLSQLGLSPRDEASQSLPELPRPISTAPSSTSTPPLSPATTGSVDYRTLHSTTSSRYNRRKKATAPEDMASKDSRRSSTAMSANDENTASKEGSRTSRFFKRVSTLGGGSKRKSVTQSVTSSNSGQGAAREHNVPDTPDTPPAVVVGDLNVQFPDSLLWKRRIVSIDELGGLQFAPTQGSIRSGSLHMPSPMIPSAPVMGTNTDSNTKGGISTRRFPLAEFKAPLSPDLEVQELPHSVVLEFPDGTTLQLACEDAMTQRQVLHLLKSYWKSWGALA